MAFFLLVFLQSSVLTRLVAFFYDVILVQKKVPVEKESSLSRGRAITFLALFYQNHIKSGERVDFLSHFLLLHLMGSEEGFIWSEYTQLYENEQKECQILQSRLL